MPPPATLAGDIRLHMFVCLFVRLLATL